MNENQINAQQMEQDETRKSIRTGRRLPIIIGTSIAVLLIAVMTILYISTRPDTQTGAKEISLVVVHSDETSKEFDIKTDEEYLQGALQQEGLIEGTEGEYGLYVLTVDGETADETKEQWWCLTMGGETHMLGVGETPIADGEQYEFTFTTGW